MIDGLDRIMVLTLDTTDTDRLMNYYTKFFDKDKIEFYRVARTNSRPINEGTLDTRFIDIVLHRSLDDTSMSITRNHIEMIRSAYTNDYEYVLFLEDDARFKSLSDNNYIPQIIRQNLSRKKEWEIFYMGYCPWPCMLSYFVHQNIVRVFTPLTCHAYILHRHSMEKILIYFDQTKSASKTHIDKLFCKIPGLRKHAIFPSIAFQERDPALYTKAMDFCGVSIPFAYLSRVLEYVSIILPIVIMSLIILFIIRIFIYR